MEPNDYQGFFGKNKLFYENNNCIQNQWLTIITSILFFKCSIKDNIHTNVYDTKTLLSIE